MPRKHLLQRAAALAQDGTVLALLPLIGAAVTLISFFPGSIDYDYDNAIQQAGHLSATGHDPSSAIAAIRLLSFDRFYVAPLFVAKVVAGYGAIAFAILRSRSWIAALIIVLLCMGPVALVLIPTLRLSYISLGFISLAVSLGLFGISRWSLLGAATSIIAAVPFSSGYEVGYILLGAAIAFWRFETLPAGRALVIGLIVASLGVAIAAMLPYLASVPSVDRASTLYVSKLSDLAGMHDTSGTPICLDERSTKTGLPPQVALDRSYQYGEIAPVIWADPDGFFDTPDAEQIARVDHCWLQTITGHPFALLVHKARFLAETTRHGWFAGHFESGEKRENAVTNATLWLNDWLAKTNWANFAHYLLAFFLVMFIVYFKGTPRMFGVTILIFMSSLGFLLPHALFGQATIARYTVVASELLCWGMAFSLSQLFRPPISNVRRTSPP